MTPRANWLAVFSFLWTFAVSPPSMWLFFRGWERAAGASGGTVVLGVVALVVTPAVAVICAFVATERGAPWDSPYRWTGLAVVAAPIAWLMTSVGLVFTFRELV